MADGEERGSHVLAQSPWKEAQPLAALPTAHTPDKDRPGYSIQFGAPRKAQDDQLAHPSSSND